MGLLRPFPAPPDLWQHAPMRSLLFLSILSLFAGGAAHAERPGDIGLGIILGEPSGLSFKAHLDDRHAFDLALDFSFLDEALHVHGDYLVHFPEWMRGVRGGYWRPYVGLGAKVRIVDHKGRSGDGLSVRIPFGLSWSPKGPPIDVFLEIVPGLKLLPETDPDFDAGLGVRWWF